MDLKLCKRVVANIIYEPAKSRSDRSRLTIFRGALKLSANLDSGPGLVVHRILTLLTWTAVQDWSYTESSQPGDSHERFALFHRGPAHPYMQALRVAGFREGK